MNLFSDAEIREPFNQDYFDRKQDADDIKLIIDACSDGAVLSINSIWGNGKTWFLKNFQKYIENDYTVLYYNIWENELADDPFGSFLSFIYTQADNDNGKKLKEKENRKKLLSAGKLLLKYTIPVVSRLLLGKALYMDKLGDIGDKISDAVDGISGELIDKINAKDVEVKSFKESLRSLADELTGKTKKPLIIIIDELDRCTPSYAIRFLEIMKHFFEVDGIVFVLAIDKNSLCEFIKKEYGTGIDPDGYLRKIINIQYSLKIADFSNVKRLFLQRNKILELNTRISDSYTGDFFGKYAKFFANFYNLSVRDILRITDSMNLFMKIIGRDLDQQISDFTPYFLFIFVLKIKRPFQFAEIVNNRSETALQQVISELHINRKDQIDFPIYNVIYCLILLVYKSVSEIPNNYNLNIDSDQLKNYERHCQSTMNIDYINRINHFIQSLVLDI
ncbi:MAG: KAP family NTPase [Treponema sp.]|nr:KAP family NTPase [Treponema sp.]